MNKLIKGISNKRNYNLTKEQIEYINKSFKNAGEIAIFQDSQQSEGVQKRNKSIPAPEGVWGISFI